MLRLAENSVRSSLKFDLICRLDGWFRQVLVAQFCGFKFEIVKSRQINFQDLDLCDHSRDVRV